MTVICNSSKPGFCPSCSRWWRSGADEGIRGQREGADQLRDTAYKANLAVISPTKKDITFWWGVQMEYKTTCAGGGEELQARDGGG